MLVNMFIRFHEVWELLSLKQKGNKWFGHKDASELQDGSESVAILGFFNGVAREGQDPVRGAHGKSHVPQHKWDDIKGHYTSSWTTQSLFINKNHWTDNTCSQLLLLSKQTVCVCVCVRACVCACVCVCVHVSSELFVNISHVLLLQIDAALICAARFRAAKLLTYLPLPGGLHCTASTFLWHGFF